MRHLKTLFCLLLLPGLLAAAHGQTVLINTMNCYWCFGDQPPPANANIKRLTPDEFSLKAGHLIGLLPEQTPLFVGLQEIAAEKDVAALAHAATQRYRHPFQPLFVPGKDTQTKQNVGALFQSDAGWGGCGRPERPSELEKELSKHLTVVLTNASATKLVLCVVHLRRPIGDDGERKHRAQCQALLRWSMRFLSKDPNANILILGDFNEKTPPGTAGSDIALLQAAQPPMRDLFTVTQLPDFKTHGQGYFDRMILSPSLYTGKSGLMVSDLRINKHRHNKEPALYTDHFPVSLWLSRR